MARLLSAAKSPFRPARYANGQNAKEAGISSQGKVWGHRVQVCLPKCCTIMRWKMRSCCWQNRGATCLFDSQTLREHRLKCDEQKPVCLNCKRLGLSFGYGTKTKTPTHELRPKPPVTSSSVTSVPALLYENEAQWGCFFHDDIGVELAAGCAAGLWITIIRQAYQGPAIRRLAVVIAALKDLQDFPR